MLLFLFRRLMLLIVPFLLSYGYCMATKQQSPKLPQQQHLGIEKFQILKKLTLLITVQN